LSGQEGARIHAGAVSLGCAASAHVEAHAQGVCRVIRKITDVSYRLGRQIVIAVIGGTLLLGGIIMLVTPGPGVALMLAGLAILAIEFAWARIWLHKLKESVGPAGRDAAQKSWLRWRQRFFGAGGSPTDTEKK
jgi:Na+(H+)/acetate symporter ActP